VKGGWDATVLMPGYRQYNDIRERAQGEFLPDVMGGRVISGIMGTFPSAKMEIVSRLLLCSISRVDRREGVVARFAVVRKERLGYITK
jgi:hypothetical protein